MPKKASGAVKIGIVREKQKNGDVYIYERKTKYDPNKGYSVTISKTLTGKIVNGTDKVVDTRPKRRMVDRASVIDTVTPTINKRHVGMLDIVSHVAGKSGVLTEINQATVKLYHNT